MLRLILICALAVAGCAGENRDDADETTEDVPIGPGSDSTTLIPPDTPMTSRAPTGQPPRVPDTTSMPLTTR